MITYEPFWDYLDWHEISTYTLITKHHVSSSTINRLRHNQPVSTATILTSENACHFREHFARTLCRNAEVPRIEVLGFEQSRLNHLEAAVKLSSSVLEHAVAELYCALAVLAVNAVEPC